MLPSQRAICTASFLTQAMAVGATLGAYSLFVKPIGDEFGASRMQMSLGVSLITLMLGITGMPIGARLDDGRIRRAMLLGTAWFTICLLLASRAAALWQLGALCIALGAAMPTLGPLASSVLVSKVFDAERGKALGIANMGAPMGAFAFALLAGQTLESIGWRSTLVTFGCVVAVVSGAVVLWGVPSVVGGDPSSSAGPAVPRDSAGGGGAGALLRTRDFLAAAGCFGMAIGTQAGWSVHFAPYLLELGASTATASALVACSVGGGVVGGLVFGNLADRRAPRSLLYAILGIQIVAFFALRSAFGVSSAGAAGIAIGIVNGGILPVFMSLLATRFGTETIGAAAGLSNAFILPFGFGVPIVFGALRDASGDYASALLVALALLAISTACLTLFRGTAPAPEEA